MTVRRCHFLHLVQDSIVAVVAVVAVVVVAVVAVDIAAAMIHCHS